MRVIGQIPHATYKISVFFFNNRHTIKIEDGLLEQSYAFRDGSAVSSLEDALKYVDAPFLQNIESIFSQMRNAVDQKESNTDDTSEIEFDEIF